MSFNAIALRIIVLLLLGSCTFDDKDLSLAVSTEEPAPTIAETVRSTLDEQGFSVTVESAADPSAALEAVRSRRVDFAIIEEPDRPLPSVVTLAPLYPSVLHVLYNRATKPDNFKELVQGANVYAGPPGGAANRLLMQLVDDFELTGDAYQLLENPWTTTPDVYFVFGGLLSSDSIAQLNGYQLFSFAADGDVEGGSVADGIALKHHHLRPFLLPRGVYNSLSDDVVLTLSIRTVFVTHEDFDDETAFDVASTLFMNAQKISLSYPLVTRELNESIETADLMLPLHSGLRRYLDRDRPGFIERYVDVLALYLTIALALLSGAIALHRHRSQVRKDRVDVYYTRLLEIRRDMEERGSGEYGPCKDKVLDVQREVLGLLIDERIAADSSLIAFLSLSNQLINELDRFSRDG